MTNTKTATNALLMPDHLEGEAAAKWVELMEVLQHRVPALQPNDADWVALYCTSWAIRQKAIKELEAEELCLELPNKSKMKNPLLVVIASAEKSMFTVSKMLALDPASRHKNKDAEQDAMARAFEEDDLLGD